MENHDARLRRLEAANTGVLPVPGICGGMTRAEIILELVDHCHLLLWHPAATDRDHDNADEVLDRIKEHPRWKDKTRGDIYREIITHTEKRLAGETDLSMASVHRERIVEWQERIGIDGHEAL